MKILHINFTLETGGAESLIVDIVNKQVESHDIFLIIINNEYSRTLLNQIDSRVKLFLINRHRGSKNLIKIFNFNKVIYNIQPDVIHCHFFNVLPLITSILRKKHTHLTIHTLGFPPKKIQKFDKLFAVSEGVKDDIENRSNLHPFVIPNGIQVDHIISQNNTKKEFSLFRIVAIGRLIHEIKGQEILINAINKLITILEIKNIHLDIIGEGQSEKYLKNLVQKYGLNEYICFRGNLERSYIYDNLHKYNLLIQPSIFEGFGLTVAEGMAAKIPVLVSKSAGPYEIIEKGKYGTYFENKSSLDCAEKISFIMNHYSDAVLKVEDAYKHVKKQYSIEKTAQNYLDNYNKE